MTWPTVAELKAETLDIIQDNSFQKDGGARLLNFFNDGIREIASKIALPALFTDSTVIATSAGYVALPADYQWNLIRVDNETINYTCHIFRSRSHLLNALPVGAASSAGSVLAVAPVGVQRLYYLYAPSTDQTLRLFYQARPTLLALDSDTPVCLPEEHAKNLLVNYAAMRAFDRTEDGVEGQKVNAMAVRAAYDAAVADLMFTVGPITGGQRDFSG